MRCRDLPKDPNDILRCIIFLPQTCLMEFENPFVRCYSLASQYVLTLVLEFLCSTCIYYSSVRRNREGNGCLYRRLECSWMRIWDIWKKTIELEYMKCYKNLNENCSACFWRSKFSDHFEWSSIYAKPATYYSHGDEFLLETSKVCNFESIR